MSVTVTQIDDLATLKSWEVTFGDATDTNASFLHAMSPPPNRVVVAALNPEAGYPGGGNVRLNQTQGYSKTTAFLYKDPGVGAGAKVKVFAFASATAATVSDTTFQSRAALEVHPLY